MPPARHVENLESSFLSLDFTLVDLFAPPQDRSQALDQKAIDKSSVRAYSSLLELKRLPVVLASRRPAEAVLRYAGGFWNAKD